MLKLANTEEKYRRKISKSSVRCILGAVSRVRGRLDSLCFAPVFSAHTREIRGRDDPLAITALGPIPPVHFNFLDLGKPVDDQEPLYWRPPSCGYMLAQSRGKHQ